MKFKSNKTKLFLVLGASTLALGSIGFASWIIGVQQQEAHGNLNVQVDNASLSNIQIIQKLTTNKVTIAEKGAVQGTQDDIIKAEANGDGPIQLNENAFKFSFSELKVKVGEGVKEGERPTKLKIALSADPEHNTANKVNSDKNLIEVEDTADGNENQITTKGYREGQDFTYLSFTEVSLDLNYAQTTAKDGYYTFDLASQTANFTFGLGTYFTGAEGNSVCSYYNKIYSSSNYPRNEKYFDFLSTQAGNILEELTAMKTALEAENALTIKISVSK